jgi:hypothetical protein
MLVELIAVVTTLWVYESQARRRCLIETFVTYAYVRRARPQKDVKPYSLPGRYTSGIPP